MSRELRTAACIFWFVRITSSQIHRLQSSSSPSLSSPSSAESWSLATEFWSLSTESQSSSSESQSSRSCFANGSTTVFLSNTRVYRQYWCKHTYAPKHPHNINVSGYKVFHLLYRFVRITSSQTRRLHLNRSSLPNLKSTSVSLEPASASL